MPASTGTGRTALVLKDAGGGRVASQLHDLPGHRQKYL